MRIAIDGFNLGLLQGTGLATYARELSHVLAGAGHDVLPIYGLNHVQKQDDLVWSSFVQSLSNNGEGAKTAYRRWLWTATKGLPHYLLPTAGLTLNRIDVNEQIHATAISARLPAFKTLYNSPGLFRAAQFYTFLAERTFNIKMPEMGVDALHLTCPLPIHMPGAKTLVTAHDIIPLVLPHSTKMNLRHYQKLLRASFTQADMIFCISETTKRDISRWFGISDSRLHLSYQAVNIPERYRNLAADDVELFLKNNYGLNRGEYFLYFGAIEPKKNVARIIDAMRMAKTDLPLVIVGKDGWLFDDVTSRLNSTNIQKKLTATEKILRIEYAPFEQLMYLVKGAKALVFPSLYEGFGLPVLEAMQMGCPVITANTTSLAEVAEDAALTVNPLDTQAIKTAIERMDQDDVLRRELIERGYAQALKFSPEKHAERLAVGYEKAGLVWG